MRFIKKIFAYFREVVDEMRKVTWPSKSATTRYAVMVIAVSIVMGIVFTLLDFIFNLGLEKLLAI